MDGNSKDQDNLNRLRDRIFPIFPTKKRPFSIAEASVMAPEISFDDVDSVEKLCRALESCERGKIVKEFMRSALAKAKIDFDDKQLSKLNKKEIVQLFFEIFDPFVMDSDRREPEPEYPEGAEKPGGSAHEEAPHRETQSPPHAPKSAPKLDISLAQKIYDRATKIPAEQIDPEIDIPEEIFLFDNVPVSAKDAKKMSFSAPDRFYLGCVMLVNPDGGVSAVGKMEEISLSGDYTNIQYSPTLIFDSEDIRYEEFKSWTKFELVFAPSEQASFFENPVDDSFPVMLYPLANPKIDVFYNELPESDTPLCIDFGTSNTTAGTYVSGLDGKKDIELVVWQDNTEDRPVFTDILPTLVYVESCGVGVAPKYLFGYEARKKLIEHNYAPDSSFFFEIKRWLNSLDIQETIRDERGRRIEVPHKDIIYAYLRYVIDIAERQFKRRFTAFHFTAPIRQKEIFVDALAAMFNERGYKVYKSGQSLDEGMAIIYHTLMKELAKTESSAISSHKGEASKKVKILILDCGGGTTDLSNCQCEYREETQGNVLNIRTGFENGDSNFGGNNITYRILQILKIKIASKIAADKNKILHANGIPPSSGGKDAITVQELIDMDENQILTCIDSWNERKKQARARLEAVKEEEDSINKIYEKFEAAYSEAEKYIPTRFAASSKSRESAEIRRNFNYLWKIAEAIKVEFFKSNCVEIAGKDHEIYAKNMEEYFLYCRQRPDAPLRRMDKPVADIGITVKEIERILYPDLYQLLTNILPRDGQDNEEAIYCLSGQSCKINLFSTLLKEFIPGRDLRRGLDANDVASSADSGELKRYCIRGSIEYVRDKAVGSIVPRISKGKIRHIHDIYFHDGKNEALTFQCREDGEPKIELIHRPGTTSVVSFVVRDAARGVRKNLVEYTMDKGSYSDYFKIEQVLERIETLTSLDSEIVNRKIIDEIVNHKDEFKEGIASFGLLSLPSKQGYGFRIVPIAIQKQENGELSYSLPREIPMFPYENEKLLTYFDGDK